MAANLPVIPHPVASTRRGADRDLAGRHRRRRAAPRLAPGGLRPGRLGGRRGPRPLALDSCLRRQRRAVPLPPVLRDGGTGRRSAVVARPGRALLPGRRVARRHLPGRHRGLLRPALLRGDRRATRTVAAPSGRRGDLHAAARSHRQAEHHRRVPALGLPRPRLEPGRDVAPGRGSPRPARCGSPALRVVCSEATAERAVLDLHATLDSDVARTVCLRTIVGELDRSTRPAARRGRERRGLVGHGRPAPAVVAPRARRSRALRPAVVVDLAQIDGGSRSDERQLRTGPARGEAEGLGGLGERRAPVPQGRQPGPDPHGSGRGHRRRAGSGRRAGRARPGWICCGSTPTSPAPSSMPPPTRPACCSGRTSRSSGATPAASASRPRARPARWSTCSDTTRRSPSGAATTNPGDRRHRPASRPAGSWRRAPGSRSRPAAPDLEPHGARSLRQACHREGRSEPARHRSLGVVPHLPQLDGTDSHLYFGWYWGDERDFAGVLPALPGWPASSASSVRRPSRIAPLLPARALARSRLGAARTHPCAAEGPLRPLRPACRVRLVRRLAERDPALPGHRGAPPRRAPSAPQVPAHGRVRPVLLRRRPPGRHLVGARPPAQVQARP